MVFFPALHNSLYVNKIITVVICMNTDFKLHMIHLGFSRKSKCTYNSIREIDVVWP